MVIKDTLFEESRVIRKLVNEGKTSNEIAETLGLSLSKIKYRITSRYSESIANSILTKLSENDAKLKQEVVDFKTEDSISNKSLVVDTSALSAIGAFDFIMRFEKVILLTQTVKEFDKYKKNLTNIFGKNIRNLLSECAKDKEGSHIQVILPEKTCRYTDDTLINFCQGKDVILYTADNALASMAKAYQIEYILAEDITEEDIKEDIEEENSSKFEDVISEDVISEEKTIQVDTEKLIQDMQMPVTKTTLTNTEMLGKGLILSLPSTSRIKYIVLDGEKIKRPYISDNIITLEKGNIVLVLTYKLKHNGLCIARYEVTDIQAENNAIYLGDDKISDIEAIDALDFSKEIKREIVNYYSLVRTSSQL